MGEDKCPVCGSPYDKKVSLSSRTGTWIDVDDAHRLCQDAEKRGGGGPSMKKTRSDTERYKFVGYLHE